MTKTDQTFISWNVNGLRAVEKKGFLEWLARGQYDVVALQETKVSADTTLSAELLNPKGYQTFWDYASEKKGYSGVAVYTRRAPRKIWTTFPGHSLLGKEGRMVALDYGDFVFLNVYFPNGKSGPERLNYKMRFYREFLIYLQELRRAGRAVIFAGDVNTAHRESDLARPKENAAVSGFLPMERAWIDDVLTAGFLDTFRLFHSDGGHYSWWDQKSGARARNVGWRIDYFFVSNDLGDRVKEAFILKNVLGSDHAPVGLTLNI